MLRNAAFTLFILALGACSAIPASPVPDSGIEGQVLIGPMCPVVQEGEECPDKPYQATLTVLDPAGRKIVQFQTDEDGRFRVPLPPGEYILRPESPARYPIAAEQPFTVLPGRFTHLSVVYDSGIR